MGLIIKFLIFFIIVAFSDLIVFAYLHELAHKKALKKAGIKGTIKWNILRNIKQLGAIPLATCYFDEKKLKGLGYGKKKDIFLSGIKMDLKILLILSVLSIISWFLLVLSQLRMIWLYILIILNVLIFIRSWHLINNVFKKDSDLDKFLIYGR